MIGAEVEMFAAFALGKQLRERGIGLLGKRLPKDLKLETETLIQLIDDVRPILEKVLLKEPIGDQDLEKIDEIKHFIGDVQDSTV